MIPVKNIREQLEILDNFEDLKLKRLRDDAIDLVEHAINRVIVKRQIRQYQDSFAYGITNLRTPLITIDSIEYLDRNDILTTVPSNDYVIKGNVFDKYGSINDGTDYYFYPEIELETGAAWPNDVSEKKNSVIVTYTSGFEQNELPDGLSRAILIAIATLYENRESLAPVQLYNVPAFDMAVAPYRKSIPS